MRRQDAGPSCGGQTTKIHALTDTTGRPFAFELNAGNVADITAAASLLNMVLGARYLLADKGRDANTIRANLRRNGLVPVIPGRINRKRKTVYDKRRYRDRHRHTHRILDLKQSQP
ncbi:MAG: transposase [Rhodospirillales bacterium]